MQTAVLFYFPLIVEKMVSHNCHYANLSISLSYLLGFHSSKGTKFYQSTKNNDLPINKTGYSKPGETKEFVITTDEPSETKNGSTLKAQFYFDEPKK